MNADRRVKEQKILIDTVKRYESKLELDEITDYMYEVNLGIIKGNISNYLLTKEVTYIDMFTKLDDFYYTHYKYEIRRCEKKIEAMEEVKYGFEEKKMISKLEEYIDELRSGLRSLHSFNYKNIA